MQIIFLKKYIYFTFKDQNLEENLTTVTESLKKLDAVHQCFNGQSLKLAELDCCSDCIQSLRERNSERKDGKKFKNFIENLKNLFKDEKLGQTKVCFLIEKIGIAETPVRSTKIS